MGGMEHPFQSVEERDYMSLRLAEAPSEAWGEAKRKQSSGYSPAMSMRLLRRPPVADFSQ